MDYKRTGFVVASGGHHARWRVHTHQLFTSEYGIEESAELSRRLDPLEVQRLCDSGPDVAALTGVEPVLLA